MSDNEHLCELEMVKERDDIADDVEDGVGGGVVGGGGYCECELM